jgi:HK97 family phage portal protein
MENKELTENDVKTIAEYERTYKAFNEKNGNALMSAAIDGDLQDMFDPELQSFIDAMTLKYIFISELWVFNTVDLCALKISALDLKVVVGYVENGQFKTRPAENHPFQDVIDNPNPFMSYNSWCYNTVIDLIMTGNSIQWSGISNIIVPIPAETIALNFSGSNSKLESYSVVDIRRLNGLLDKEVKMTIDPTSIIHLRKPNPCSMYWGLSPFIPGRKSVLFNRYSQDYLNSFYQKGAIPGLAMTVSQEANERVALRMLRQFEQMHTGTKNMRRPLLVPKGIEVKEITPTLVNQDLEKYVKLNREDIISLLKVPKHELSLQEAGSLGSNEYQTALKNFWNSSLLPLTKIIESELTKFFRRSGKLKSNEYLMFDTSKVEALQEDEKNKADLAEKLLKTHTLNEVRKKLYALDPVQGGDTVQGSQPQQGFQFPMGFSFQGNKPDSIATTASNDIDVEIEGEETQKDIDIVKPKMAANKIKAAEEKVSTFLKKSDAWFDVREKKIRDNADKAVNAMERFSLKIFSDMAVDIIRTVAKHLKEKGWDDYLRKAVETGNPQSRAKLVGRTALRRRLRNELKKFESEWVDGTREILKSRVDVGYDTAFEIPFNMPSKKEIAGLRARSDMVRLDALEDREGRAFEYLSETTINHIYQTIDNGIQEGKTVQDIAKDLKDRFSDIKEIGSRAMTIARTETLIAVSLGQAAAMKDAMTIIPDMKKMWISANDERVRESHKELHGDIVDADESFDNGLLFPRDPRGDAGEVINCRCSWIMVPSEQMSEIDSDMKLEADIINE